MIPYDDTWLRNYTRTGRFERQKSSLDIRPTIRVTRDGISNEKTNFPDFFGVGEALTPRQNVSIFSFEVAHAISPTLAKSEKFFFSFEIPFLVAQTVMLVKNSYFFANIFQQHRKLKAGS